MYRINPGIFRGLADMCLGVIGCHIYIKGMWRGYKSIRVLTLGMMAIIIWLFPHTSLDYVFPIVSMICIINEFSFDKCSKIQGVFFRYLRKITLSMYFIHVFILRLNGLQQRICEISKNNEFVAILIELAVMAVGSIILEVVVTSATRICAKVRNCNQNIVD